MDAEGKQDKKNGRLEEKPKPQEWTSLDGEKGERRGWEKEKARVEQNSPTTGQPSIDNVMSVTSTA